ncbi:MAG: response regulator transcription factor [Saccharofermentanales bacterium]
MENKILIAEDEAKLRTLVSSYLKKEGFKVVEASNGQEAVNLFSEDIDDVVLLDIMMPVKDGLKACKEIRAQSNVPIVMLTARSEEYDELSGFSCGADEYITKPFSPAILITRIKAVLKRSHSLGDDEMRYGDITLYNRERRVKIKDEDILLTPKEFDLLYYLILNKNIVLNREMILEKVWGFDYFGDERTVDTHIKCLRAKLMDCGEYIKTVRKFGYKLSEEKETD